MTEHGQLLQAFEASRFQASHSQDVSMPAGTRQTIKHDRIVVVVRCEIVTLVSLIEENVIERMLLRKC